MRGQGRKINKEGTSGTNIEVTGVRNNHWLTRASPGGSVAVLTEQSRSALHNKVCRKWELRNLRQIGFSKTCIQWFIIIESLKIRELAFRITFWGLRPAVLNENSLYISR